MEQVCLFEPLEELFNENYRPACARWNLQSFRSARRFANGNAIGVCDDPTLSLRAMVHQQRPQRRWRHVPEHCNSRDVPFCRRRQYVNRYQGRTENQQCGLYSQLSDQCPARRHPPEACSGSPAAFARSAAGFYADRESRISPLALVAGPPPATIGAFYDTISTAFSAINPTIDPNAHFIDFSSFLSTPEPVQIKTIADAQNAITTIKTEGEGTKGSPDEPPGDSSTFAHYYAFKQIFIGKTLVHTNGKWSFTGAPIQFPTVVPFTQSAAQPDPSTAFNQTLTQLLQQLEACWMTGASFFDSLTTMSTLQSQGQTLIQQKIRPEFLWVA
jgi:hypothetical protein